MVLSFLEGADITHVGRFEHFSQTEALIFLDFLSSSEGAFWTVLSNLLKFKTNHA
jgi:hypothetical protein